MDTPTDLHHEHCATPFICSDALDFSWDKLTGLADRHYLLQTLQSWLGGSVEAPVSVTLFNIDGFKAINRTVGHRIGDRWLCAIARRLQAKVGNKSLVGRLSGDEFLLISHDQHLQKKDVTSRARDISAALSKPVAVDGKVMARNVSVSSSSSHGREVSAEQLLGEAEKRMRSLRRNRMHMPKAQLNITSEYRDLQRAIDAGRQIEVHYQPEVDLHSGQLVGVEALARWRHPRLGLQPASRFIGLAERSGLVVPLSWLVLHRALHQMTIWRQRHQLDSFTLRVNASPLQVMTEGFAQEVLQALQFHGLPASTLCIEVTEHQVMKCQDIAKSELHALRENGVAVAIDDFGIGHSSLSRLKDLPADCLKIDRSFVSACSSDDRALSVIEAITRLAHAFKLEIVAEGVETDDELIYLQSLGVTRAQGKRFGLAMPPEQCEGLFNHTFCKMWHSEPNGEGAASELTVCT